MFPSSYFCLFSVALVSSQLANAQQAEPLFNGKDLNGWKGFGDTPEKSWSAKNRTLVCSGKPGASWIYYDKEFSDFELNLDFNMSRDANSGVFIRAPKAGDPWVSGIEIQLLDDYGGKMERTTSDRFYGCDI